MLALSECNHYLRGVCTSQVVWQQLFCDYFLDALRDMEDASRGDPPFIELVPVSDPHTLSGDGKCPRCGDPLVAGFENEPVAVERLWRLQCQHTYHHRCLEELKEKVAMPSCDACDHPLDTGSCDEETFEENYEQVFSKRLIAERVAGWSQEQAKDWMTEFRCVYEVRSH